MALPSHLTMFEAGPRDGLQNEPQDVSTAVKIELIERLADAGLRKIEGGSFVSPKWVPKMADTADVYAGLKPRAGVVYPALVVAEVRLHLSVNRAEKGFLFGREFYEDVEHGDNISLRDTRWRGQSQLSTKHLGTRNGYVSPNLSATSCHRGFLYKLSQTQYLFRSARSPAVPWRSGRYSTEPPYEQQSGS